jgi:hypothetical protein
LRLGNARFGLELMNFVSRRDKAMVDRKSDLKNGVAIAFPVYSNILTLRN